MRIGCLGARAICVSASMDDAPRPRVASREPIPSNIGNRRRNSSAAAMSISSAAIKEIGEMIN